MNIWGQLETAQVGLTFAERLEQERIGRAEDRATHAREIAGLREEIVASRRRANHYVSLFEAAQRTLSRLKDLAPSKRHVSSPKGRRGSVAERSLRIFASAALTEVEACLGRLHRLDDAHEQYERYQRERKREQGNAVIFGKSVAVERGDWKSETPTGGAES